MNELNVFLSILGSVLVVGVSYGGLYSMVKSASDRLAILEQKYDDEFSAIRRQIREVEAVESAHIKEVIQRLSRMEACLEMIVDRIAK